MSNEMNESQPASARRPMTEDEAILLVGAARTVGEPLDLHGAAHRRRRRAVRLCDHRVSPPATEANALGARVHAQRAAIETPYDIAAMMIMFTAFIVAIFYCLDALHGERRDRSILFWKSLPVSDLTTVLSKAFVPLAILPLLTFVIVRVTQLIMLLISSVVLAPSGLAGTTWNASADLPTLGDSLLRSRHLGIWEAPVYGWLLLVGGWARRATFLWAVLPWLAICAIEKIVVRHRLLRADRWPARHGRFEEAFVVVHYPKGAHVPVVDRLTQLDPLEIPEQPRPLDRPGHRRGIPRRRHPAPPLPRTALVQHPPRSLERPTNTMKTHHH